MATISLHTEAPDVGATQDTNEAKYAGYARVIADTGAVFFPAATDGGERLTHYAKGDGAVIETVGELTPEILVEIGSTPSFLI